MLPNMQGDCLGEGDPRWQLQLGIRPADPEGESWLVWAPKARVPHSLQSLPRACAGEYIHIYAHTHTYTHTETTLTTYMRAHTGPQGDLSLL